MLRPPRRSPVPGLRPGPVLAGAVLLALAACDLPEAGLPGGGEGQGPQDGPEAPYEPSPQSVAMARQLAQIERSLVSRGLLRTDAGGPDAPFNARMLAQNFVRIALFDEYTAVGSMMMQREVATRLRRWEGPVRVNLQFGASVPEERRVADRREVSGFVARLARATGHRLSMVPAASVANFHILVLDEDERRASAPLLRAILPGIGEGPVRTITDMDRGTFCLVFAFSQGDAPVYTDAIVVIRAEHPDLMRRACYHEEIAQGLGLANDSPAARPSIFNDDEEFALLTRHDELLLRMLYDPRLRPGMTAVEARPIAEGIARELLGGES